MDISLKNAQILNSLDAIDDIMEFDDMPVKLVYAASKNKKRLEQEKDDLDDFQRDLLEKHAVIDPKTGMVETLKDDDGNPTNEIKFKSDEDKQIYVSMMNELYDEKMDLSLHGVKLSRVESVELPPSTVFAIRWMFDD